MCLISLVRRFYSEEHSMSLARLDSELGIIEYRDGTKKALNIRVPHTANCRSLGNTCCSIMSFAKVFALNTPLESLLINACSILLFTALPAAKLEMHCMVNLLYIISLVYNNEYIKPD